MTPTERPLCNQRGPDCTNPASYRFTWPGRDEAFICERHVGKMRDVAQAMGVYVEIIPLNEELTR